MNDTNTTEVLIDGKIYTVSGAEDTYMQQVAAFINKKLEEVRKIPGYSRLDSEYKRLLLNLNLADEYFRSELELKKLVKEKAESEKDLYSLKHDLISTQMKLDAALKQQKSIEKSYGELKAKYEELTREKDR